MTPPGTREDRRPLPGEFNPGSLSKALANPPVKLGSGRLTKRRLLVVAGLVLVAVVAILLGDPLAHPEAGTGPEGARGVTGVPRIAEIVGIAIAFVIALPPREEDG